MADVKISELPAASTPLAGTEQIPLVQDATTKQITVSNLLTSANLGTPSAVNLANATNVPMDEASGVLAVANGGSGTATPALVAGTNVTISGSWPNQTINSTYSGAVTSVTGTAPVVSSGGTTPAISMAAATGSVDGYLTSTDWTTFNSKQPAGSYLTNGGALGTPSSGTATNLTGLPLSTGVTGLLPVANGGTGTATPNLVAGSNVTISGTWPNQTIAAAGAAQVYPGAGIANSTGSAWGTSYTTTGSGTVLALATSPTFVTPALGVPASGDFSTGTFTWPTFNQNTSGTAAGLSATLAVASGGTGQTSYTDGQLLIGNSTGNTLTKATLTAGANITITNSAGGITIAAAGGGGSGTVTSVSGTGTVNGITLSGTVTTSGSLTLGGTLDLSAYNGAGAFTTLSASSSVTLSGGTANGVTYLNGSKVLTSGSALTFDGTTLANTGSGDRAKFGTSSRSIYIAGDSNGVSLLDGAGQTGNGWYVNGASSYVAGYIGSSEQMRLTSTGLGIGTSSPAAKLTVAQSSNVITQGLLLVNAAGTQNGGWYHGGASLIGRENGVDTIYLASGNVGIGTSSPSYKLQVNGTTTGDLVQFTDGTYQSIRFGTSTTGIYYNNPNGGYQAWNISGSEKMRIDSSGNLGLGVTPSAWGSPYKVLSVNGIFNSIAGNSTYGLDLVSNAYYSSGWKYTNSSVTALKFDANDTAAGQFTWQGAGTGTADGAITWTTRMVLDSSGNLGVGSTSISAVGSYRVLDLNNTTGGYLSMSAGGTRVGALYAASTVVGLEAMGASAYLQFIANGSERARIDSSGNLLVGKNVLDVSVVGAELRAAGPYVFTTGASDVLVVNRQTDDGVLILFRQGNVTEGNISVSGTTVSYNGGHLSRWAQTTTAKDESLVKGTVLSNLDEMNQYVDADGNPVENEQLNKVKVSDVEGDANVAGVFVNWTHDDVHNVDEINMAMTGDMIIRIAQGVTVVRGDLLMSAGDGTAKPQGDDIIRSKTVAKVTSNHVTCTYADGSYCVPCVLMAC